MSNKGDKIVEIQQHTKLALGSF